MTSPPSPAVGRRADEVARGVLRRTLWPEPAAGEVGLRGHGERCDEADNAVRLTRAVPGGSSRRLAVPLRVVVREAGERR
ncbi:hypothetical protein [Saccharothrix syringae]|uniref:Uncharacterized protein n=1 Tax=Saccharothrix syringae TaxID=103733 RepID=A0A5Q0H0E9_SACSY|nr:hypothetical protein [Saccharothrix syringae]QFZ19678.1 hypothetical protein EKG83_21590 [Saccharothrix syringae]